MSTDNQQKISDVCDNVKKFLLEKNQRYGAKKYE